jgi:hypothetical protein
MRLVLGLDALDLRLVGQRVEKRPHRTAGIAEVMLERGHLEPLRDRIDYAHFPVLLDAPEAVRDVWQQNSLQSTKTARRRPGRGDGWRAA